MLFMVNPSWPLPAFTILTTLAREITVLLVQLLMGFSHNGYVKWGRTDTCIVFQRYVQEKWSQPELIS